MKLEDLKKCIDDKSIAIPFYIFQYDDNDFLPMQYIHEIRKILNVDIDWIDNISIVNSSVKSLFDLDNKDINLRVYCCDLFDFTKYNLVNETNLIVICHKVSDDCEELFSNCIINFPKLEQWQIKDYVYSLGKGVEEKKLDYLINLCGNDIYRLDKELHKLSLFNENEKKFLFDDFIESITDLSNLMIFDFTNAIIKKDISTVTRVYEEFRRIDIEPLGLVTLLYNNIKNIIKIQMSPNPTAESCGMKSNQFWAIKNHCCGYFNKDQLMYIFSIVTDIDRKLKTGDITNDLIVDYLVCHILSC